MASRLVLFIGLTSFLCCVSIEAQHLQTEVSFSQYFEEYSEIGEATLLTSETQAWGERQWIRQIEPSLQFQGTEERPFNQMGIVTLGQVALWHNNSPDNVELDLYLVPFALNVVSPLQDHLNEDQGAILYFMEEDYIKVEFRNVALAVEKVLSSGSLTSRINYTVEIDPANDRVRFHYGPSQISSALQSHISENGILVGIAFEAWEKLGQQFNRIENSWKYLKGSPDEFNVASHQDLVPSNPQPGFTSFPPNGTVYEFEFSSMSTSVDDLMADKTFRLFPNPGNDQLHIDISESGWSKPDIEVFDVFGLNIYKSVAHHNGLIFTSDWPAGIYFVRISADDSSFTRKWVKR